MIMADLMRDGWYRFPHLLSPALCEWLAAHVTKNHPLDGSIFLTEAEYEADPQHKGVNPRPGRNYADALDLGFIEELQAVTGPLSELLGGDYVTLDRKLVCGVRTSDLPEWVRKRLAGVNVPNLGAYVRPEYRDITYFHGIDFHQDLIDYPSRTADFLTLYVYLTPVADTDAPLVVILGSHKRGAEIFPHADTDGRTATLMGPPGTTALWHACTLHGTSPVLSDRPRLSLRYIFARKDDRNAAIDEINAEIGKPLSLERTRRDLEAA